MSIKFVQVNPATSVEAVTAFEVRQNFTFSPDYRQFLLSINGGKIERGNYVTYYEKQKKSYMLLRNLLGIYSPDLRFCTPNLDEVNNKWRWEFETLEPHLLIIADDEGGHYYIILSMAEQEFGHIFLWLDGWGICCHIANSFTEFLECITDTIDD